MTKNENTAAQQPATLAHQLRAIAKACETGDYIPDRAGVLNAAADALDVAEGMAGDLTDEQIVEICAKEGLVPCLGLQVGRAIERAAIAAHLARQVQAEPVAALAEIGKLIGSQDNRHTEAPIFVVEQKKPIISDADYNDCRVEWRETEHGDYALATAERAERLEALFKAGRETPGWRRYEVTDVWEFVTACFTEQGCRDYLARNGHNLRETRIYAYGSYRNEEFRTIRNSLISLATPVSQAPVAQADLTGLTRYSVNRERAGKMDRSAIGKYVRFEDVETLLAASTTTAASGQAAMLEQIAQSWDGCMYDAPGEMMDVGAALRRQFKQLGEASAQTAPGEVRDQALEEAAKLCESEICACCWKDGAEDAALYLAEEIRALKGQTGAATSLPKGGDDAPASLTRCAAARDGECSHAQCPQLRDCEPAKSGRHCPLDNNTEEE